MPRSILSLCSVWALCSCLVTASRAAESRPGETLLPATTKAFLSIPSLPELDARFNKTQLGKMMADPVMKLFSEDIKRQIKEKMSVTGSRLGLNFEDLEGVKGEVAIALIQPGGDKNKHALSMLIDSAGDEKIIAGLKAKVAKNMGERKAKASSKTLGGMEMLVYTIPVVEGENEPRVAYYFVKDGRFVAVDEEATALDIVKRFAEEGADSLAKLPAFKVTLERTHEPLKGAQPQLHWFIEPFGYVEASRASHGGRKKRGTDLLKVLRNQGFDCIQGAGGTILLADEHREVTHRTLVYAPAVPGAGKERYKLAARMLDFPNAKSADDLKPPVFVPQDMVSTLVFQVNVKDAFEYVGSLVDEMAGDEGVFDDIMLGLEKDKSGPKVNLRKDLVHLLGTKALFSTDYVMPISPTSERWMGAVEANDPAKLTATIAKLMTHEGAKEHTIGGFVVWENKVDEIELPKIMIEGAGDPAGDESKPTGGEGEDEDAEEKKDRFKNSAITVAHGYVIMTSNLELMKKVLANRGVKETLDAAADFQHVAKEMMKLASGADSFHLFSRTDEEFRISYELFRTGKMPESETMMGKILNNMLKTGKKGEVRKAEFDGSKMPEYDKVKKYFGPSGTYVRSMDDGWLIVGAMLPNMHLAKEDVPKTESPKAETPKSEKPKVETPKAEAPKPEAPKVEEKKEAAKE